MPGQTNEAKRLLQTEIFMVATIAAMFFVFNWKEVILILVYTSIHQMLYNIKRNDG